MSIWTVNILPFSLTDLKTLKALGANVTCPFCGNSKGNSVSTRKDLIRATVKSLCPSCGVASSTEISIEMWGDPNEMFKDIDKVFGKSAPMLEG